jgi:hypothetical protein
VSEQWMKDAANEIAIPQPWSNNEFRKAIVEIIARHYSAEAARVQELRDNAKLVLDFIPVLMKAKSLMDAREADIKLAGMSKALGAWEK